MKPASTSTSSSDDDGDGITRSGQQSWDLTPNPICLTTISKRKSAFLPYKPTTTNNSNLGINAVPSANRAHPHHRTTPSTLARLQHLNHLLATTSSAQSPSLQSISGASTPASHRTTPATYFAGSITPPVQTPSATSAADVAAAGSSSAVQAINSCVLTNLQRGNTEANVGRDLIALTFHERCGQGEIVTDEQLSSALLHRNGDTNAQQNDVAVDAVDEHEYTALHWASHYGQLHTVQLLLKHGAAVERLAPDLVSPLLLAAAGGHHEVVRCLLQHEANAAHMDIVGNTALMYAAAGNHPHTTNELLQHTLNATRPQSAASEPENGVGPDDGVRENGSKSLMLSIMVTNEDGQSAYSLAVQNRATLAQAVIENFIVSTMTK